MRIEFSRSFRYKIPDSLIRAIPAGIGRTIALIMICLIYLSCGTTEPESVGFPNKKLFTSARNGVNQLFIVDPDGTNIWPITSPKFSHYGGRWSPDAKYIVCNTEENQAFMEGDAMVIINTGGRNEKMLAYGGRMSWYPDGSRIIFTNWPGNGVHARPLYLQSIGIDGKNAELISMKYTGENTFSPDGTKIAFTVAADSVVKIEVMNYPDLSNPVYIGPKNSIYPNWSPDGKEIAFSGSETGAEPGDNIYIMNSDGSNVRKITYNASRQYFIYACWSPNGESLIFIADAADGSQKSNLYMVNKDGTNLHKVINDDSVTSCDWSR
jgi:Tol biopolymer transport system component